MCTSLNLFLASEDYLEWPRNSSDVSLIENLWNIVRDLLRHHFRPRNVTSANVQSNEFDEYGTK